MIWHHRCKGSYYLSLISVKRHYLRRGSETCVTDFSEKKIIYLEDLTLCYWFQWKHVINVKDLFWHWIRYQDIIFIKGRTPRQWLQSQGIMYESGERPCIQWQFIIFTKNSTSFHRIQWQDFIRIYISSIIFASYGYQKYWPYYYINYFLLIVYY